MTRNNLESYLKILSFSGFYPTWPTWNRKLALFRNIYNYISILCSFWIWFGILWNLEVTIETIGDLAFVGIVFCIVNINLHMVIKHRAFKQLIEMYRDYLNKAENLLKKEDFDRHCELWEKRARKIYNSSMILFLLLIIAYIYTRVYISFTPGPNNQTRVFQFYDATYPYIDFAASLETYLLNLLVQFIAFFWICISCTIDASIVVLLLHYFIILEMLSDILHHWNPEPKIEAKSVQLHLHFLRLWKHTTNVFSSIFMWYVCKFIVIDCIFLLFISWTKDYKNAGEILVAFIIYFSQFFIFAWAIDRIRKLYFSLSFITYDIEWFNYSKTSKISLMLIMQKTQEDIKAYASPFITINLQFFVEAFRFSFSLYTLLSNFWDN